MPQLATCLRAQGAPSTSTATACARQQPRSSQGRRPRCQLVVAKAASDEGRSALAECTRRIKELGRQGRPKDAVNELAQMARLGIQPDSRAATALLHACASNRKMDMAQSIFDELFGDLLTPDEVTFAVLLRGYGDADPPRWSAISDLLDLMERSYGIPPTAATFNILLEICCRTNDQGRAEEVVARMGRAGVQPDEFTAEAVRQRRAMRSLLRRAFG